MASAASTSGPESLPFTGQQLRIPEQLIRSFRGGQSSSSHQFSLGSPVFFRRVEVRVLQLGEGAVHGASEHLGVTRIAREAMPRPETAEAEQGRETKAMRGSHAGVERCERLGLWRVHLPGDRAGQEVELGYFDSQERAAEAYDIAALKLYGEAARTNLSKSRYRAVLRRMERATFEDVVDSIRSNSIRTSRFIGVRRLDSGTFEAFLPSDRCALCPFPGILPLPCSPMPDRVSWERRGGLPLGVYTNEEDAARAYDRAAVSFMLSM